MQEIINRYDSINKAFADDVLFKLIPFFRSSTPIHRVAWQCGQTLKINVAIELSSLWQQFGNTEPYPLIEVKNRSETLFKHKQLSTEALDQIAQDTHKLQLELNGLISDSSAQFGNTHRVVITLNRVNNLLGQLYSALHRQIAKQAE